MHGAFEIYRGGVQLADGLPDGALVIDGPQINGQRLLDVEPYLFASQTVIFDRAGDVDVCTFVIARRHATWAASLDHSLRHGKAVRGVADLEIRLTEDGETNVWKAPGAGWEATEVAAPEGYSSAVRYRVVCPIFNAPETIDGSDLLGDLDGGDDDVLAVFTDDWNCQSEEDDDASVVETFDGEEIAA